MKKLSILFLAVFASVLLASAQEETTYQIWPGMPYKLVKEIYDPSEYIPSDVDEFHPFVTAAASALLPGVGQMINKETGVGLLYLGGFGLCQVAAYGGFITFLASAMLEPVGVDPEDIPQSSKNAHFAFTLGALGLSMLGAVGSLTLRITSATGASKMAKRKNMLYHDLYYSNYSYAPELNISPDFTCLPGSSGLQMAPGISMKLSF